LELKGTLIGIEILVTFQKIEIIKEEDVLYARRKPIMNVVIIKNTFALTVLVTSLGNKIKK
jgi:hypothetical protein